MSDTKVSALTSAVTLTGAERFPVTQSGLSRASTTLQMAQMGSFINVKWYGALGDGVTNDASAIQTAINAVNLLGGVLYFPPGIYLIGTTTLVFKNKITYRGSGKDSATTLGTVIKYTGTSDAVQINNPINSSTAANITIEDLWIQCTTRTAGKAALADIGSSYLNIHRVGVSGNDYGIILDQSEITVISECDIELSSGSSTAGIWMVNGADHTGGASAFFTNRIVVEKCQFNGTVGSAVADDGGSSHSYIDNNFNACAKHIRVSAQTGIVITGNEFETCTSTAIDFAATQLDGTGSSASNGAVILGNVFSSPDAINFITYAVSSLSSQTLCGNAFTNSNVSGAPTTGIGNITAHFGFGNIQLGTGTATPTVLGNILGSGSGAGQGISLRVGARTLAATENFLFNQESPVMRYYIGDGSGFSFAFSKRTGSATTDLGTMTDAGVFSLKDKFYPAQDTGVIQTAAALYAGTGVPNNANGANGDFYFRGDGTQAANTVIYHKQAGAWVALVTT